MPTYGDWVQDPDYEAIGGGAWVGSGVVNTSTGVSETVAGGAPADPAKVSEVIAAAAASGWGGVPPNVAGAGGPYRFAVNFDAAVSTTYSAGRELAATAFSANYQFTNWTPEPTVPPDAIGWEWEVDNRATVLGGTLNLPITHYNIDTTASPDVPVNGTWSTDIVVGNPGTWGSTENLNDTLETWDGQADSAGAAILSLPKGSHLATEHHDIDVSAHLSGGPHDGFLVVSHNVSAGTITLASHTTDEQGVEFGSRISGASLTYLLRPARYRFIYADVVIPRQPRIAPPRRLYPRNDGLGPLSGSTRLSGTSSQQRSGRILGGYL